MLWHIARKELVDHMMSLRFAMACGLCLAVFLLTTLVLAREYREAASTYNMNEVMQRNQMLQARGEELPDGEAGELWVESPRLARGYWGRSTEAGHAFEETALQRQEDYHHRRSRHDGARHH